MPPLVRGLLKTWWRPDFALAYARVGLAEALATGCPLRVREWRKAVLWLEWIAGRPQEAWHTATSPEAQLTFELQETNRRVHGCIEKLCLELGLDDQELDTEAIPW